MGAPGSQFLSALRDVFGPATTISSSNTATWAQAVVAPTNGRIEAYLISYSSSAAAAATIQLIDASATGIGGTVRWQTHAIPANTVVQNFYRPLLFSKGLTVSYTATAAATVDINVQYSPVTSML